MEEKETKPVKICIFDVGDTLVESKAGLTLPLPILADLNALRNKGYILGLSTIRTEKMLGPLFPQFNFDFLILLNGGMVKVGSRYIFSAPIPLSVLYDVLERASAADAETKQYSDAGICYAVELTGAKDGFALPERAQCCVFDNETVHITASGVTKAKALRIVCNHYGAALDDVVAFGDGYNDIDMLEASGKAVAMGGSPEAVCRAADMTTLSVAENGIPHALRALGLL